MTFLRSISAELSKLRYAPIAWLCIFVLVMVTGIVFAASYIDQGNIVQLGKNPWSRHMTAGLGIYGVFMLIPFTVMLVSTAVFIENHSRGWKFAYSTPRSRSHVFYAKLVSIFALLLLITFFIFCLNILCAYLLDFMLPEIEFRYHEMSFFKVLIEYVHVIISLLGIIGIQYFLSLRFKGFLIPMSFGVLAFIVGIIVGSMNKPMALYYPYSYPNIVRDYHMFTIDKIGIEQYGWLNSVELYSIIVFVFFIACANVLELRKDVS